MNVFSLKSPFDDEKRHSGQPFHELFSLAMSVASASSSSSVYASRYSTR